MRRDGRRLATQEVGTPHNRAVALRTKAREFGFRFWDGFEARIGLEGWLGLGVGLGLRLGLGLGVVLAAAEAGGGVEWDLG